VDRRQIQKLAAGSIDARQLKSLAEHGEDLLVERKAQVPTPERLGAEVASMANMLGGWILLGVDDKTREFASLELADGIDLQSHIGHLLRKAIDPVPPFLADTLRVNDATVGFVRVFESTVPILVSGSGAIYIRDAGGKLPISDHRALLELATRGRHAEEAAGRRALENELTTRLLGVAGGGHFIAGQLRSVVRAAPLTVTPQFADWPVTDGPTRCMEAARYLARQIGGERDVQVKLRPYGRAVHAFAIPRDNSALEPFQVSAVADCAGLIGVAISLPVNNVVKTHDLRRNYIRPPIEAVAYLLESAEAFGDAVFDLNLLSERAVSLQDEEGVFHGHDLPRWNYCGSAMLGTPADEEDRAELAKRWEREIARETGIALWEPSPPTS
jgi:hypothetical protein